MQKNKCVFSDIFDTCIFRKIHPYKIIEIWASQIIFIYNINMDAYKLLQHRISIYNNLLKNNEEPNYQQIIEKVYEFLRENENINEVSFAEFYKTCHKSEIELEIKYQFVNKKTVKYLKREKKKGKRIIAISDQYLGKEDIKVFLRNLDLIELFDNIYVSSDYNKTKRRGDLYKLVLNKEKCDAQECLMIGDNYISDIKKANEFNIRSKFRPNIIHHLKNKLSLNNKIDFIKIKEIKENNKYLKKQNVSFLEYASIFYEFTQRLYDKSKNDNICNIIFIAREGYFLKEIFDR